MEKDIEREAMDEVQRPLIVHINGKEDKSHGSNDDKSIWSWTVFFSTIVAVMGSFEFGSCRYIEFKVSALYSCIFRLLPVPKRLSATGPTAADLPPSFSTALTGKGRMMNNPIINALNSFLRETGRGLWRREKAMIERDEIETANDVYVYVVAPAMDASGVGWWNG
ncbi:hypothetical protein Ancab_019378 [Ancistrocladus abbreviatus]